MIDYISWQTEAIQKRLLFFPDRVLRESHACEIRSFSALHTLVCCTVNESVKTSKLTFSMHRNDLSRIKSNF